MLLFAQIKKAEDALKELRKACTHPTHEEVTWSWRVGCYDQAYICADCGEFIKYKNNYEIENFDVSFTKGDSFEVISKYGNPIIIGTVEEIYHDSYKGNLHGIPVYFPYIKSTNGVSYSLDQIKKIWE